MPLSDVSALLAGALNEEGAEQVMQALSRPHGGVMVMNLTEIVSTLRQRGMGMAADRAWARLDVGVSIQVAR